MPFSLPFRRARGLLKPCHGSEALQTRGTVIIVPGGNYEFLCPTEGLPVAAWLARHGIHSLVLRYRLRPTHGHKEALADLEAAVQLVRSHKEGLVAALGFSAGGHLVPRRQSYTATCHMYIDV